MSREHKLNRYRSARHRLALGAIAVAAALPLLPACGQTFNKRDAETAVSQSPLYRQQHAQLAQGLDQYSEARYAAAEVNLRELSEGQATDEGIRRQALAALVLLYLSNDNPRADVRHASAALNTLLLMPVAERDRDAATLLISALKMNIENALRLQSAQRAHFQAEQDKRELQASIVKLNQAIARLRELSLQ